MKISYLKIMLLTTFGLNCFLSSLPLSAKIEVKLSEPEKFRDISVNGYTKKKSIQAIKDDLTLLFTDLSKDIIPEDENLLIEITDVDLAGDIEPMVGPKHQDLRIVRDTDNYRLIFKYEYKNEKGEMEIKNFVSHFSSNHLTKYRFVDEFEKDLKRWFKETFAK